MDLERKDWRTFRADRIGEVAATGGYFEPRKLPRDVVSFVSQAISYEPFQYRARLKLKGSTKELGPKLREIGERFVRGVGGASA